MTVLFPLSPGQRIRAERVRARRRSEATARAETETDEPPRPAVFERERPAGDEPGVAPDLQLHAQMNAEVRRGLKAGPLVHGAARRTYLGTEYAGPADRRARAGRSVRTSV
jgi:hypothetical protein